MNLLTVEQLAEFYHLDKRTILRKMNKLGVRNQGLSPKKPLFDLEEIRAKQGLIDAPVKPRKVKTGYTKEQLKELELVGGL